MKRDYVVDERNEMEGEGIDEECNETEERKWNKGVVGCPARVLAMIHL
jgi:hypothetical protein